jgi:hypothetical protein
MTWRIYYDNETVFTSDDGNFDDAPTDGVLFVLQKRGGQIETLSGADYYAMLGDEIIAVGDPGPLLRKIGWIKMGRWTSHRVFERIGRLVALDAKEMAARDGS